MDQRKNGIMASAVAPRTAASSSVKTGPLLVSEKILNEIVQGNRHPECDTFDITPYLRSRNLPWAKPGRVIVSREIFTSILNASPAERRIVPAGTRLSHLARQARYQMARGESEMSILVPDSSSTEQREIVTHISKAHSGHGLIIYMPGKNAPQI